MKPINESLPSADTAQCGCQTGCAAKAVPDMASAPSSQSMTGNDRVTLRIPAMDCPNEENLIRQALADIDGIRTLRFELAARNLSIDGSPSAQESALLAIRKLGFEAEPVAAESKLESPSGFGEIGKAVVALLLAIAAEALDYFAPDTLPFKGLGMALAAAAIALRVLNLSQGLGGVASRSIEHECLDGGRRDRSLPDRPMAGSCDGHGALCYCRTH